MGFRRMGRGDALAAAARVHRLTVPAAASKTDPRELCCVATRLLCVELYGATRVDLAPVQWWHLDVEGGAPGPWSPVDAAVRAGVAEGVRDERAGPPDMGVYLVQLWRGPPLGAGVSGHTLVWITDGAGDGWQLDSVDGRAYDARPRSWAELVAEARGGLRAARLLDRRHPVP